MRDFDQLRYEPESGAPYVDYDVPEVAVTGGPEADNVQQELEDTEPAITAPCDATDHVVEEVQEPSAIIELATPERVLSYLPEDRFSVDVAWPGQHTYDDGGWQPRRVDENHPLGQWSLGTTSESPAVLYDDGAAFCTPVLAFDEAGSAIHCHDSPVLSGFGNLEQLYFPELPGRLAEGKVTAIVGGTNVDVTDVGRSPDVVNPIDRTIDGIEERLHGVVPDADLHALVSRQYDNQRPRHEAVPASQTMCGFIFIPRYIATDGRNHVLAIGDRPDADALRGAFYWTRLPR